MAPPPRSISPDSLQSSISSRSSHSFGPIPFDPSSSSPIHPTLFIRDPRRKKARNAHHHHHPHQLTESDFGFRSPSTLATKLRRLLSSSSSRPAKALFHHPQPSASSSCLPSSPLASASPLRKFITDDSFDQQSLKK